MDRVSAVEEAAAGQLCPLLDEAVSVMFYDLTTVRIRGTSELPDDMRAWGLSKDWGTARQFVLAVVQTAEGLPIAHQVHAGSVGEVSTLLPMIEATLKRYPSKRVVLVADRGLLSLGTTWNRSEGLPPHIASPSNTSWQCRLVATASLPGKSTQSGSSRARRNHLARTALVHRPSPIAHNDERADLQHAARRETAAEIQAEAERMVRLLDDETPERRNAGASPAIAGPIGVSAK